MVPYRGLEEKSLDPDSCVVLQSGLWRLQFPTNALQLEPDSIHSDHGRNFESQVFKEMCHLLEINKMRSTAYHLEGNGQVENLHNILKSMLKVRVQENPQNWHEHLDYCAMA